MCGRHMNIMRHYSQKKGTKTMQLLNTCQRRSVAFYMTWLNMVIFSMQTRSFSIKPEHPLGGSVGPASPHSKPSPLFQAAWSRWRWSLRITFASYVSRFDRTTVRTASKGPTIISARSLALCDFFVSKQPFFINQLPIFS
jgi:hypothetical protein